MECMDKCIIRGDNTCCYSCSSDLCVYRCENGAYAKFSECECHKEVDDEQIQG